MIMTNVLKKTGAALLAAMMVMAAGAAVSASSVGQDPISLNAYAASESEKVESNVYFYKPSDRYAPSRSMEVFITPELAEKGFDVGDHILLYGNINGEFIIKKIVPNPRDKKPAPAILVLSHSGKTTVGTAYVRLLSIKRPVQEQL